MSIEHFYYVDGLGVPIKSSSEIDGDWVTQIVEAEYDDLVTLPVEPETVPLDPSLIPPEPTPLEKLESIGLSVEELRTLLNENA